MDLDNPINCLTFNVLRAGRHLGRGFELAARTVGLTAPQFSTLAILSAGPEATVSQLAALLGTDRTTLTRNLDLMTERGWIALSSADDLRLRPYALTDGGRVLLAEAMPVWQAYQARVVGLLGEDAARDLLANLQRLGA